MISVYDHYAMYAPLYAVLWAVIAAYCFWTAMVVHHHAHLSFWVRAGLVMPAMWSSFRLIHAILLSIGDDGKANDVMALFFLITLILCPLAAYSAGTLSNVSTNQLRGLDMPVDEIRIGLPDYTPGDGLPYDEVMSAGTLAAVLSDGRPWSHAPLGIPALYDAGVRGDGACVAVIDTGIEWDHRDLSANLDRQRSRDFTGNPHGYRDGNGHGCVAPWDKVYTSLCGLQCAEYLFDNAPGIEHHFPDRQAVVKDVSRYGVYTASADPLTGLPLRAKVLAVHKLRHSGSVYEVKTQDATLTLTPWHPVYIVRSSTGDHRRIEKRRADELKTGDQVLLSGAGEDVGQSVTMPYRTRWQCVHCSYESRGGKRPQCKGCNKHKWHEGPKSQDIRLDDDLAFWLGLVASDGHLATRQRAVDFCNKDERIGQVFSDLCVKMFGVEPKKYRYSGKSATTWRLNCGDAHRLAQSCGIPVGNKSRTLTVPNLITKSPRSVILAFIAGMIEGDGNVRRKIRLTTGSEAFASELVTLLHTLGIRSSRSEQVDRKSGNAVYYVGIGGDAELIGKLRVKDGSVVSLAKARRSSAIKSITVKDYDGPMYDMTVEGTTTYIANGHVVSNTHCSGIVVADDNGAGIVGVAPNAVNVTVKGLTDGGSGSGTALAASIRHAADQPTVDILSMSFGAAAQIPEIAAAINYAEQKGKWLVAAAGNSGPNSVNWPGALPNVLCVAATEENGAVAPYSSTNDSVDVAAPGSRILSTIPGNKYASLSGTSMACPFVAGVLALAVGEIKKAGKKLPSQAEMMKAVYKTSRDIGLPGYDPASGSGLIQPAALIAELVRVASAVPGPVPNPGLKVHRVTVPKDADVIEITRV